jgi:hypothetical protein
LIDIYKNGLMDEDAVNRVLEIFKLADAQTSSQKLVDRYCREARGIFNKLNIPEPLQKDMEDLAEFLTGRKF